MPPFVRCARDMVLPSERAGVPAGAFDEVRIGAGMADVSQNAPEPDAGHGTDQRHLQTNGSIATKRGYRRDQRQNCSTH